MLKRVLALSALIFWILVLSFGCGSNSISPANSTNSLSESPNRIAAAVSGTQTALAEATYIAATLTVLALPRNNPNTPVPLTVTPPPRAIATDIPIPAVTPFVPPTIEIIIRTITPEPISESAAVEGTDSSFARLINQHTQLCLTSFGADIVQLTCQDAPNQLWKIQDGGGPFKMVTQNGECLSFGDVDVVASNCSGSPAWTLKRWGDYQTIENARIALGKSPHGGANHPRPAVQEWGVYFQIVDGGNCVDVDGWNHDDGGRIIYWPCNGTIGDNANQLWAFYR